MYPVAQLTGSPKDDSAFGNELTTAETRCAPDNAAEIPEQPVPTENAQEVLRFP